MKVSAVLSLLATVMTVIYADNFSAEDQAIWIDRHNYFRTTGLPWSAGNMRRIGWDADLATRAASTAAECSTTVEAGMNVYQSSSSNSSSILDEAIQQWVVETSVQTIKTMAQPNASGQGVGAGVYNSYSQVVWASTTSVGCGTASCSDGTFVVCEYSPVGNDGTSVWYVHADTTSDCPSGTTASSGLCIVEGDAANNQIAPIPAGKLTYQVYPAYVADVQTILIDTARGIAKGSTASSPTTNSAASSTNSTDTATPAPQITTAVSTATKTPSLNTTSSTTSSEASNSTPTQQESSKTTKSSSSSSSSSVTQDDSLSPGTVKASSASGSKFGNEATSPSSQEKTTTQDTTSPTSPQTESTSANIADNGLASRGISTLSLVGMFVLGIGAVAGIVIFVHYRVSMRQQNDILLDGGIRQ